MPPTLWNVLEYWSKTCLQHNELVSEAYVRSIEALPEYVQNMANIFLKHDHAIFQVCVSHVAIMCGALPELV